MRVLLLATSIPPVLPQLEHESLIGIAALILLFLSVATVIWPKFTGLVRMIWTDFRAAVDEVLDFRDHLKARREGSGANPANAPP